jgi:hypothetical protein
MYIVKDKGYGYGSTSITVEYRYVNLMDLLPELIHNNLVLQQSNRYRYSVP